MNAPRSLSPAFRPSADANVQPRHPADAAAWIWHPQRGVGETAFLRFTLEFEIPETAVVPIHVSADQRYQLRLDGAAIGHGPDRGHVAHWPVASHGLELAAGRHRLEALVWWIADGTLQGLRADPALAGAVASAAVRPPVAQSTWRGGFLLAAEGAPGAQLDTGRGAWRVEDLTAAVRLVQPAWPVYHDIGPEFCVEGARWSRDAGEAAAVVLAGIAGNPHGVQRPGWRLQPSGLPAQQSGHPSGGRLRAWVRQWTDGPFAETTAVAGDSEAWTALFQGGTITIPPGGKRTVLWDFEEYVCGYARLATAGGAGARVRIDWAESLYEALSTAAITRLTPKGRRDVIDGKVFRGWGDEFLPSGTEMEFPAFWWRSGRYLRLQVSAAREPLVIRALAIETTGYPLGAAAPFVSDDAGLNRLAERCTATTRSCAHDVWADCPYYEQVAYVGDSRLAALVNYAGFRDDRLSRRMLQLFDESRRDHGLVAMRAPGAWTQVSVTYALLWVLMVRDFAWWRDEGAEVRVHLRGVRAMLDEVQALTGDDGLLGRVPGWPFIDWVPEWNEGCGPGVREGDSSLVNLHWLLALRAQAELEAQFGEPELAALASRRAAELSGRIMARFWCASRGLLADTSAQDAFSEHAQALGLISGLGVAGGVGRWVDAWLKAGDLARATGYFSFYLLEALAAAGRDGELHRRLAAADAGRESGLLTMPESPEPTRSDCHGWSAHGRWHLAATVAGVRPLAPRFAEVCVEPRLGELQWLELAVIHPRGQIEIALRRADGRLRGLVVLPEGVTGEFRWGGEVRALRERENVIDEGGAT